VLSVDIVVMQVGGSLLDCIAAAAYAALRDTMLPLLHVTKGPSGAGDVQIELDDDPLAGSAIAALESLPLLLTFTQIAGHAVADARPDEEECAEGRCAIALTRTGRVCGVTSEGPAGMAPSALHACVESARLLTAHTFDAVDEAVAEEKRAAAEEAAAAEAEA
jgi:exosome complex RNA-binding protein Rrp42 (RNase PH superfamily)